MKTIDQRGTSLREYDARRRGQPLDADDFEDDELSDRPSRMVIREAVPYQRKRCGVFLRTFGYCAVFVMYAFICLIGVTIATVASAGQTLSPGAVVIATFAVGAFGTWMQYGINERKWRRTTRL